MNIKCTKDYFLYKIRAMQYQEKPFITECYDINKKYDNMPYLIKCIKKICKHYVYEYSGCHSYPDWRNWKIIYNNIFIEIVFNYDNYNSYSILSLIYFENEINKTDIEKIIHRFSFLDPKLHYKCKTPTKQHIEKIENEKKKVEEIIQNHEKKN